MFRKLIIAISLITAALYLFFHYLEKDDPKLEFPTDPLSVYPQTDEKLTQKQRLQEIVEASAKSEAIFEEIKNAAERVPLFEGDVILKIDSNIANNVSFFTSSTFEDRFSSIVDAEVPFDNRIESARSLEAEIHRIQLPILEILPQLEVIAAGGPVEGFVDLEDYEIVRPNLLRFLAKVLSANAYLQAGKNQSDDSIQAINNLIIVSNNIENRHFIGLLSCIATEAILTRTLKELLTNGIEIKESTVHKIANLDITRNIREELQRCLVHEINFIHASNKHIIRNQRKLETERILENRTMNLIYDHYRHMLKLYSQSDLEKAAATKEAYFEHLAKFSFSNMGGKEMAATNTLNLSGIFDAIEKNKRDYADLRSATADLIAP